MILAHPNKVQLNEGKAVIGEITQKNTDQELWSVLKISQRCRESVFLFGDTKTDEFQWNNKDIIQNSAWQTWSKENMIFIILWVTISLNTGCQLKTLSVSEIWVILKKQTAYQNLSASFPLGSPSCRTQWNVQRKLSKHWRLTWNQRKTTTYISVMKEILFHRWIRCLHFLKKAV